MNKSYCIYCHTNKINDKKYIGQTNQKPENRWVNGKGYKNCIYFYNAIKKYGWDNFEHEILYDNLTLEEANQLEKELIAKYDTINPEKGYNLRTGGENSLLSEETKRKIKENHYDNSGENHYMYGKHLTEERKKRISEANKGKILSDEHKRKIGESNKGDNHWDCSGKNNPMYGKHMSEETKQKISESHKGEKNHMYGKRHTEETKEKMRKNHYDNKGKNHYNFGKHLADETKRKISEGNKGKILSEETKQKISKSNSNPSEETRRKMRENHADCRGKNNPNYGNHKLTGKNHPNYGKYGVNSSSHKGVYCIELNKFWDCIKDCAEELGLRANLISVVCRGKQKTTGGYHFKYLNDIEDIKIKEKGRK